MPKDLEIHRCLAFGFASALERDWRFTLSDGSQQSVRVPGRLGISGGAMFEAALAGLDIILQAQLIPSMLKQDIAAGRLIRLFADLLAATSPEHIFYLLKRKLTAKLASFVDFVIARFGPRAE
jgi:DNA-binding transcriptional LysR family regulator